MRKLLSTLLLVLIGALGMGACSADVVPPAQAAETSSLTAVLDSATRANLPTLAVAVEEMARAIFTNQEAYRGGKITPESRAEIEKLGFRPLSLPPSMKLDVSYARVVIYGDTPIASVFTPRWYDRSLPPHVMVRGVACTKSFNLFSYKLKDEQFLWKQHGKLGSIRLYESMRPQMQKLCNLAQKQEVASLGPQ